MQLLALLLCALALAHGLQDDAFLFEKQKNLLQLFVNLQQPNYNQQQAQLGNSFDIYNNDYFTNTFAVKQFQTAFKQGFLPRGDVFYFYNPTHLQQAIQLFDVFYFAKDYDTFYKAACWARDRLNEGQFVYALSVAIVKRQDTQGVVLPPQSEVYPFLYINTRAVQLAQTYKQTGLKEVHVFSNNTDNYFVYKPVQQDFKTFGYMNNMDNYKYQPYQYQKFQEGRVAYFREDVYLNQHFTYQQIFFPNWFDSQKYSQKAQYKYGERFYYYLQQLLARYNLERYANGLSYVVPFQFNQDIESGYSPELQYHDGKAMPARPNYVNIFTANQVIMEKLQNLDRRFTDAIDSRTVMNVNGGKQVLTDDVGVEILGNIVQANEYSVNNQFYSVYNGLYGYFDVFRKLVGSIVDPYFFYKVAPGAVENDSTALRDPIFYQIIARIVNHFQTFKSYLKPYTEDQVKFQGVEVKSVAVDKLYTYMDKSDVELYNAINYQQAEQAESYKYKAWQSHLNYKPFTYDIQVSSEQSTDAIVRIFFGPKVDLKGQFYTFDQASRYFVEIDRFFYNLKAGQNKIQRSSQDSTWFMEQQPNTRAIFTMAEQGTLFFNQTMQQQLMYTMPRHLMLPRGSQKGQEYMFIVAVHQYQGDQSQYRPVDNRPLGFPFDRPVMPAAFQEAKNIYFQTVTVFHKEQPMNKIGY